MLTEIDVQDDGSEPSRTGPRRRDSDWGGHPRSHEEDLAWAAKRSAVSVAAATLSACDGATGAHWDDVVHLCDAVANELGIHGQGRAELLAAAQLHDIGKVAIPPEILDKPGPLDELEWTTIREHTVVGARILESVPELDGVARLVRHSHERWDGGGYPDGLAGEEIPLGSRIVFCADAFHAIRADRPYRPGHTARAALAEIQRNAGTQFDPEVAAALVRSAGQTRKRFRHGVTALPATLRSRRLMALLVTLAIGGSALAAVGLGLLGEENDARVKKPNTARTPDSDGGRPGPRPLTRSRPLKRSRALGRSDHAERHRAGGPAPGTSTAKRDPRTRLSPRPTPRTLRPSTAKVPVPPTTAPRQRPLSRRGRSGEAPRRPAQPRSPAGVAPGRSEEAPGRRVPAG